MKRPFPVQSEYHQRRHRRQRRPKAYYQGQGQEPFPLTIAKLIAKYAIE